MNKIYFGTITGTHGIKGELKVKTEFEQKSQVLKVGFPIYILNEMHTITSIRSHQNKELITIDSRDNINDVLDFRGQEIYINREDLSLKTGYLMQDLIGFSVIDQKEILGTVMDIEISKAGYLLKVKGEKKFYIPFQEYFIQQVSVVTKQILVNHGKELIL